MKFTIDPALTALWPETRLGLLTYHIQVAPSSESLLEFFDRSVEELRLSYGQLDAVSKNPHIAATRQAYKALGKSPSEYRNSAEAMLRRIVKGNGLYHINNAIELNNLISVSSGFPIGSYDLSCLQGQVVLRRAADGAHYEGIGKSSVNIEHLPVLHDELGPVGSPTSDSQRAMIREGERDICAVIFSFDGSDDLEPQLERFAALLRQYGAATGLTWEIV